MNTLINKIKSWQNEPIFTYILLAINLLVYGWMLVKFGTTESSAALVQTGANSRLFVLGRNEWWRFLTAGFIHIGFDHLAMNMLALYFLGSELEQFLGKSRFLIIYLVSIMGGSLFTFAVENLHVISAGASSGIFGLFATYLVLGRRYQFSPLMKQRAQTYTILIVINFIMSIFSPTIDFWGHFGGVIYGIIFSFLLGDKYHKQPNSLKQNLFYALIAIASTILLLFIGIKKGF